MNGSRVCAAAILAALSVAFAVPAVAEGADAKKLKDTLTGDARGAASANARCRLFTPDEIGGFLGAAVGAPENAAGGAGCQWSHKEDGGAIVTVVEARYFAPPSLLKGYRKLPAIGPKAWVAPDSGWSAGSVEGEAAIVVNLDGKTASEARVVALLQETIRRWRR